MADWRYFACVFFLLLLLLEFVFVFEKRTSENETEVFMTLRFIIAILFLLFSRVKFIEPMKAFLVLCLRPTLNTVGCYGLKTIEIDSFVR